MTKVISMGTLVFITFAMAVVALGTSMFHAVILRDIKPTQVTVIEKTVASPSAVAPIVVTATPSTAPVKKAVVTKPVVSVSPEVAK